jgi:molecular chaperone GrpE
MSEKEAMDNEMMKTETDAGDADSSVAGEPDPSARIGTPSDPFQELKDRLQKAEEDAKQNYDRFLRASAELENYKKRTARETENFKKFANETLLKDLLPVVDNLERAIVSSEDADNKDNPILEGIHLTLKEILRVLNRSGVKPVEALEKPFDPCFHEAMMQKETDEHPDNTVIQEYQKGYLLHDRLLRPAMVVVSKANNEASEQKNSQEE